MRTQPTARAFEDQALANLDASRALVAALTASGARLAVVSPGSRSTPLVLAADENPEMEIVMATDERSAAFFALGAARQSNKPVVLICTSGTAAANYLPAIAEASISLVPLVVLTADRPPELCDVGAAQTILQSGLYGGHVRWQVDVSTPGPGGPTDSYYGAVAARAAATALTSPRGPVHLNVPFREPLMSRESASPDHLEKSRSAAPVVRIATEHAPTSTISGLVRQMLAAKRGVLVCGPRSGDCGFGEGAAAIAKALNWPLLADPLSGARSGDERSSNLIENYDLCLRSQALAERMRPDFILRFGGLTASKPLESWLASLIDAHVVAVAPPRIWPDPSFRSDEIVWSEGTRFAADVALRLTGDADAVSRKGSSDPTWCETWSAMSLIAARAREKELDRIEELFEGKIANRLLRLLPAGALLHAGNSMPVRDVDTYGGSLAAGVHVDGNRGANGIDGVLSTAAGAAIVTDRPTFLYVGDLSFLHDLSGLQLVARHSIPLTVIVANNDGGGIFESLPQASLGERFEQLFATPHGHDLAPAVAMCNGHFESVSDWQTFDAAWARCRQRRGLNVIEVKTDRKADAARRRSFVDTIVRCIDGAAEAAA